MNDDIQLSLCIPTNGVIEWVQPVLDSIYEEKNPIGNFEVIVTDNGNNEKFYNFMQLYCKKHNNLIYKKTKAIQFENQIEVFKLASGKLIKFVNHRMVLLPGAINYLLKFIADNQDEQPFVYFLDNECAGQYDSFDHFVKGLSYWSSYSAGVAMWKSDFDNMDLNKPYNKLFPHTNMIFSTRNKTKYIINGCKIMKSLPTDETKKGNYNLFYAFAVEYPSIILRLYRDGDISFETFKKVKDANFEFIASLYFNYLVLKKPCSYDLSNYKQSLKVFYEKENILIKMVILIAKKCFRKISRLCRGNINVKNGN